MDYNLGLVIKSSLSEAVKSPKVLRVYYVYRDRILTYNVVVSSTLTEDELEEFYISQTEVLSDYDPSDFEQNDGFIVNQVLNHELKDTENLGTIIYAKA